jgi:hypothetical protein
MTGRYFIVAGAVICSLTLATAPASAEWLYQSKSEVEAGRTTFTADTTDVGVLSFACDSSHGGRTWLAMPPQNYAEISTQSDPVPPSNFEFQVDSHAPIAVRFGAERDALVRAPVRPASKLVSELIAGRQVTMRSPTGLTMRFSLRGSRAAIGKVLAACRADGAFAGAGAQSLSQTANRAMQSNAPVANVQHSCFCCIRGHRVCQ